MTDTLSDHADPTLKKGAPLIEMTGVGKTYGAIGPSMASTCRSVPGEVTCVLGDNGAGKVDPDQDHSPGLHSHSEGSLKVDGKRSAFLLPP